MTALGSLADADPDTFARWLATLPPERQAAVSRMVRRASADAEADAIAEQLAALDPASAAELLARLTPEQVERVQDRMDERDLDAFVAGRQMDEVRAEAERSGIGWVRSLLPQYASADFAPHMRVVWEWAWQIRPRVRAQPLVCVWFRGGSKSTTAECALTALGATGRRRYALYISGTQPQADKHVQTLGAMLESPRFAAAYPDMARRAVTQYGSARGWSRTRLHTAAGFVVDALGLSVEARGIRIEEERPDFIVLDDIDSITDGPAAVERKIELLTQTILPAGSQDLTVLAIQNVIHPNSIFARLANLAEQPADFLADRIVSGPVPAIEDLDVQPDEAGRWTIRSGTPTWSGYGLDAAQAAIDTFGVTAFLREGQHEVEAAPGGMFDHLSFRRVRRDEVPPLVRTTCWVDPAVTDTDSSDAMGIQIDGKAEDGTIYRLWSWEHRSSPERALTLAIRMAVEYGSPTVGVETDQGGDTWESVYRQACEAAAAGSDGGDPIPRAKWPGFRWEKAGAGHGPKVHRASQMLADYERAQAPVHVLGTHGVLEAALRRFPRTKPYDLVDAAYWSWYDLRSFGKATSSRPGDLLPPTPISTRGPAQQMPQRLGQAGILGQIPRVTRTR